MSLRSRNGTDVGPRRRCRQGTFPGAAAYGIDAGLKQEIDWREDPLIKFFESMRDLPDDGGPHDLAENHDRYILAALEKKLGKRR
jgi:hypothetical protein